MKTRLLTIAAFSLSCHIAGAQGADDNIGNRDIEMRPNEKRYLTLKPSERNPYAKRVPQDGSTEDEEQNTEELAIRKKIGSLTVAGSSRSYNGLRLLLGDILLERGKQLPQLVSNQTQHLKVVDITSDKIVLGWMDVESGELTGKTMQIAYDVTPGVRYVLRGQTGKLRDGAVNQLEMGIIKPNGSAKDKRFRNR